MPGLQQDRPNLEVTEMDEPLRQGSISEVKDEPTGEKEEVQANEVTTTEDSTSSLDNGSETPAKPQLSTTEDYKRPPGYQCDGRCGTHWTYANDMYICKECHDVQFDERCLKLLRAGKLEQQVCSKTHEMLHVLNMTRML